MRNYLRYATLVATCVALVTLPAITAYAARNNDLFSYGGSSVARSAISAGDVAMKAGDVRKAVAAYKKAITLDPRYVEGQKKYVQTRSHLYAFMLRYASAAATVNSAGRTVASSSSSHKSARKAAEKKDKAIETAMLREYRRVAQGSRNAVYAWVLGTMFPQLSLQQREGYCHQALRIDRKFAWGWQCLAKVAILRTDKAHALSYLKRAVALAPNNEELAGDYAYHLAEFGTSANMTSMKELLAHFPDSGTIAYSVVSRVNHLTPEAARIAALEKLMIGARASSEMAHYAAENLFTVYMWQGDLKKAKSLGAKMVAASGGSKYSEREWTRRYKFADALVRSKELLADGKPKHALSELLATQQTDLSGPATVRRVLLVAKARQAAGDAADALTALREGFVSHPSDALLSALYKEGAHVGESKGEVRDALWRSVTSGAKPAHGFTLPRLDGGGDVSLSDYRGKAVIIDFFFPSCGPCRVSAPYLEALSTKFKGAGLVVLAINGVKDEQALALRYLRNMQYDFVGLAGNHKFAHDAYGVVGYPTTFFVGPRGNVLFRIRPAADNMRIASTAIRFMLARAKKDN